MGLPRAAEVEVAPVSVGGGGAAPEVEAEAAEAPPRDGDDDTDTTNAGEEGEGANSPDIFRWLEYDDLAETGPPLLGSACPTPPAAANGDASC